MDFRNCDTQFLAKDFVSLVQYMQRRIWESFGLIDVLAVWRERHPSQRDRIRRMRSLSCGFKVHQRNPHFSRRFSCDFSFCLLYKRKLRCSTITRRAKLCHMENTLTFTSPLKSGCYCTYNQQNSKPCQLVPLCLLRVDRKTDGNCFDITRRRVFTVQYKLDF